MKAGVALFISLACLLTAAVLVSSWLGGIEWEWSWSNPVVIRLAVFSVIGLGALLYIVFRKTNSEKIGREAE